MAAACPAIDPTKPPAPPPIPSIDFDLGSVFAPSAKLSIPWPDYAANSKLVPGGNRYYSIIKPADPKDPIIGAAFGLMNAISRQQFWANFGAGKPYANMKMSDVLAHYKGKLVTSYGKITVAVQPKPDERAVDFTHRGGYLLWVDPQTGVFTGKKYVRALDPPSWIKSVNVSGVHAFYLFTKYLPDRDVIDFEVKLEYDGTLDKINNVSNVLIRKFCATVTSDKLNAVGAYAALYPKAAKVAASPMAVWSYWSSLCGRTIPTCSAVQTANGPIRLTVDPNALSKYPIGSIAYFDGSTYLIAIPVGLNGLTATHTIVGSSTTLPIGVAPVTYWIWQRSTKPLYARTSFWIGVGGLLAAGATTAVIVHHRR